ncbi:MAG: hypothetical protein AAB400_00835 [Patescibacteria group bacterium]
MPEFALNIRIDPAAITNMPSWDAFTLIFFVTAVLIYSFFVSRERLALVLVSLYSALALSLNTPLIIQYLSRQPSDLYPWYRLGLFVGLFLIFFLVFSTKMSMRTDAGHNWLQALILSFFQVGLLMASILMFVPREVFPSGLAQALFTGDIQRSFWMVAPVIGMMMLKSHPPPLQR